MSKKDLSSPPTAFLDRLWPAVQLHDRFFYIFCIVGAVCSLFAYLAALFSGLQAISVYASFLCFVSMILLSVYSLHTKNILRGRIIICLSLNCLLFPITFLVTGGINSGMSFYFLLGLFVTALILEKIPRFVVMIVSIISYILVMIFSFRFPDFIVALDSSARMYDTLSSFAIVSLFVYLVTAIVISEYSKEHAKVLHLNELLEQQTVTDDLTGLYNRRYLMQMLHDFIEQFSNDRPLSIALFDLDDFKAVNDKLGHLRGNDVLSRFSRILQEETGLEGIATRYGGEEFIVVLPEYNRTAATEYAERVRLRVSGDRELAQLAWQITVSCGVAQLSSGGTEDSLINAADLRLYEAKANGKNMTV